MKRTIFAAAALGIALAAAACGDDATGPAPRVDEALAGDLAVVVADATLDEVADLALLGVDVLAPAGPVAVGGGRGGAVRAWGSGRDVERSFSVTFYDAAGVEQVAYDPLLTARAEVTMEVEGTHDRPAWDATIQRSREITVTGLEGEEETRTFNGTGSQSVARSRHDTDGLRTYALEADVTITDVVRAVDRDAQPWPLSGTITHHVVVTFTGGPLDGTVRERTVTVTFDGTRWATLSVDGETFQVDLGAGDGDRCVGPGAGWAG